MHSAYKTLSFWASVRQIHIGVKVLLFDCALQPCLNVRTFPLQREQLTCSVSPLIQVLTRRDFIKWRHSVFAVLQAGKESLYFTKNYIVWNGQEKNNKGRITVVLATVDSGFVAVSFKIENLSQPIRITKHVSVKKESRKSLWSWETVAEKWTGILLKWILATRPVPSLLEAWPVILWWLLCERGGCGSPEHRGLLYVEGSRCPCCRPALWQWPRRQLRSPGSGKSRLPSRLQAVPSVGKANGSRWGALTHTKDLPKRRHCLDIPTFPHGGASCTRPPLPQALQRVRRAAGWACSAPACGQV